MSQPIWSTSPGSLGSFPAKVIVSAGTFIAGDSYTIVTIGNTDFTLIGASSNTVGITFTATGAGSGTGTANTIPRITVIVVAQPVLPAISVTYTLISGTLPQGLTLSTLGVISGFPGLVISDTTYTFVIRATDNLSNIRDRTFSMLISGVASPEFTTPEGSLFIVENTPWIEDSTWVEYDIKYDNPVPDNEVAIRVIQGQLPPGLEINAKGLIRGYASPPTINVNLGSVNTSITTVNSNIITGPSTKDFRIGRPIIFSGTSFGGIIAGQTYFISFIFDQSSFTISTSANGETTTLSNDVGFMTAILPNIAVGQPTIRTYSFTLKLESLLGSDLASYSIQVRNQNATEGLDKNENTRVPTIYNTRPPTYLITEDTPYFGYYVLPPDSQGFTYSPTQNAFIGKISSDNEFSFKVIGKDFDDNVLNYSFQALPLGLTGDTSTGWIAGNPVIAGNSISEFSFRVAVNKAINPGITSPDFSFSFIIINDLVGDVVWITPANLGQIENSSISTLSVVAESDVALAYRLIDGNLPPNLTLTSDGNISGTVAYQPTNTLLGENDATTFTFTVQAYAPLFSTVVQSTRTFTLTVTQEYVQPTDTLYIKCAPSIQDRNLIRDLLNDEHLIPNEYLYRPEDPNFGKATNVTYVHAYGIYANDLDAYVAAVTKNHYWRNITLGEINTAVAKNDQGEIIYEVVYSSVIDNLINPEGVSVSKEILWPRFIDLNLGPWYTSVTNLYTSYIGASVQGQSLLTENINNISTESLFTIETESGQPAYYTSLTSGLARILYPNSLPNMREQVGDVLGQEYNFRLYPKWMTSQQANGSTLGFTPAWVICYTKPGFAEIVKTNIENNWKTPINDPIRLNQINFKIDRFTVDKSLTYNYDNNLVPATWTGLPSATPVPDPKDSKDFFVLFPRETILPDETQY
jgi:hypothetical protein